MKLNLKSRLVAAICEFKAKNDIRYYLNGIYVEPLPTGGAVIVATNGHAMGVWRDTSATVERPAILRIGKQLREACTETKEGRLALIDDRLTVTSELGTECYVQPNSVNADSAFGWEIKAKYPDWKIIVPDECQTGPIGMFNSGYVKLVHKALKIAVDDKFAGITLRQADESKSIFVTCINHPNFAAIIMPMRSEGKESYPAWITESKAQVKEAELPLPGQQPSDTAPVEHQKDEVVAQ